MEVLFAGVVSRLDRVGVFLSIFTIFDDFGTPFRVVFWDRNVKKWSMEKQAEKESNIFMRAIRLIPGNPGTDPMWSLKRT